MGSDPELHHGDTQKHKAQVELKARPEAQNKTCRTAKTRQEKEARADLAYSNLLGRANDKVCCRLLSLPPITSDIAINQSSKLFSLFLLAPSSCEYDGEREFSDIGKSARRR